MATQTRFELVVNAGANAGRAMAVKGPVTLGSGPTCTVRINNDPSVCATHAKVEPDGNGLVVRHVGERGETLVDGQPISEARLDEGSVLKVGKLELKVRVRESLGAGTPTHQAALTSSVSNPAQSAPGSGARPSGRVAAVRTSGQRPAIRPDDVDTGATMLRPSEKRRAITGESAPATVETAASTATDDDEPQAPSEPTVMRPMPLNPSGVLEEGNVIDGRYKIIGRLAAGGMGEVYRAVHVELGKVFALKVMKAELSNDPEFVDRFKREAVASSRIGQQNIVDISDFGRTENGRFFFVMEFLEGPTLSELIRQERVFYPTRAAPLVLQIARALGAAHQQGIVHRDLKPENVIVLQRDGQRDFVKVVDFGVAKVNDGRGQGGHTALGMVVGTPQYMSPEQAAGLPVDARSDIYSLGLIAYELISGRPTFEGETPSMVMAAHINMSAPPLVAGLADSFVPPELEAIIMRMLEKQRENRPGSMAEVIDVLETFIAGTGRATPRATQKHRSDTFAPQRASGAFAEAETQRVSGKGGAVTRPNALGKTEAQPAIADDELPAIAPRSKLPLIIGAVAAVLLLGGVAAMALRSDPPVAPVPAPTPAPTPVVKNDPPPTVPDKVEPPKPETVKLSLTSTPEKVEVLQDDALIGTTPLELSWEKGKALKLTFKKDGYLDETRALSPMGDVALELSLKKKKVAAPGTPKPPEGGGELMDAPY